MPRWRKFGAEAVVVGLLAASGYLALLKEPGAHRLLLGFTYLLLLAVIVVHDVRTRRAPNRLVYPAIAFAIAASLTLGWSDGAEALLGGLSAFVVLLIVALAGRGAMGFGDVKVAALCGIAVGFHGTPSMIALTFISGLIVAAPLVLFRVRDRSDTIALTPFLAFATALSMCFGRLYLWR